MELGQDIKVVIFDFDGTLFDLNIDWDNLRTQLGIAGTDISLGELIQKYRNEQNPELEIVTRAELNAVQGRNFPSVSMETLERLQNSYRIAIFTRNSRQAVEALLVSTAIEKSIYIVGREDVRKLKPDPEGLTVIMHHFKAKPEEAVLVGDTYHDVKTAKAIGTKSIIVANPKLQFTPEGADAYIETLADLK